ncbi:MAG TPA: cell envelope integrity protein CreD [Burkholderiales bacterium]|nr:cell envelope integrity protein CreD [Burkholderiales bacterium]
MRFPLLGRFTVVAGVAIALLLPLSMIRDKLSERRDRADAVQKAFADQTSGAQALAGPLLALTCEETYVDERVVHQANGKPLTVRETKQRPCPTRLVLPAALRIEARAPVEQRWRGIYPIRLYRASLALSGSFELAEPPGEGRAWKDAFLIVGISDVRGIKQAAGVRAGSRTLPFVPGPFDKRMGSGVHAPLGPYDELPQSFSFHAPLELAGTTRLDIAPLGGRNEIRIESSWRHPSFVGAYPPDRHAIGPGGFSADWRVDQLATGGNAFWREAAAAGRVFSGARLVGVELVEPVNPYSMSFRAMEYGFLFVLLTFAAFSLVELAGRVKLHPVQYALTGSALAVFFLLLISLSEHIRFGLAYLAAASACVALLAWYLRHVLAGVLFGALYAALYVLLQSEDHALLLGSLLVFGVLAAIMLLTRRLDWTALSGRLRQPLADAP